MSTARVIRAVVSAAVGLAMLAGCVKIDGDLQLNGTTADTPDTLSGTLLVAVNNEWAIGQGADPAALGDAITEELAAGGTGVTGEVYDDGEYTGSTLTFDSVPFDRISQATDGAFTIVHQGEDIVVTGDLSALTVDGATVPWMVDLSMTFPSEITSANGTIDGRTVTWSVDAGSADQTISAVASAGPVPWWTTVPAAVWVLAAMALIAGGLAWWFGSRERRRAAASTVGAIRQRQAQMRGGSTVGLGDMMRGPKSEAVTTTDAKRRIRDTRPKRRR